MTKVAQEPRPGLLFRERFAADVSSNLGIRPHCGGLEKIIKAMPAESKAFGFEDRNFFGGIKGMVRGAAHPSSLQIRANHCKN
jgi:hypothetical protein